MNIITAVNQLIFRLKPKPENGGKSKPFYPNGKDLLAINIIMEFVEKSLTDNSKNRDIRIQKLYLILFKIYLQEYECPVSAEKQINDLFNKPINYHLFKIKSLLECYFIDNLVTRNKEDFDLMNEISILKNVINNENDIEKLKKYNIKIKEKKEKLKNLKEIDKELLSMELSTEEIIESIKINMNNLFTLTNV